MVLKLPRLSALVSVGDKGERASKEFTRFWDQFAVAIEGNINDLADAVAAIQAAQDAADSAQTAAETAQAAASAAQTAAENAQTSADTAQSSTDTLASVTALNNSYVTSCSITAQDMGTDIEIDMSVHFRLYGDGTQVVVAAGGVAALAYDTDYWIYYDDAARAGGTVTYHATSTYADAFATNANPDRHFVGAVHSPLAGDPPVSGNPANPPNYVGP